MPLDIGQRIAVHDIHGPIYILHALCPPQAICDDDNTADEDGAIRRCTWVGPPRSNDHAGYLLALDDAIQHIHAIEGRCNQCEACRGYK
jgi:hypothetical protein